jgi:tetratricopeptide (TPR) repeat protein
MLQAQNKNQFALRMATTIGCVFAVTLAFSNQSRGQDMSILDKILELPIHDHLTFDSKTVIAQCSEVIQKREKCSKEIIGKALLARGNAYLVMHKLDEAIQDFDEYCAILPENADVLFLRANVQAMKSRHEEARKDIEKLNRLYPEDLRGLFGRAMLLLGQGNEKEGLKALDMAISRNPKHAQSYFVRGALCSIMNPIESLHFMNKFLELTPYNGIRTAKTPCGAW